MKLIEIFKTKSTLHLEEAGGDSFRLRVPFLEADVETLNHRVYPSKVLQAAISELQKQLELTPGFGSSRHLEKMEADDVSHFVESVAFEKGTAYAILRVLPTALGKNVSAIIRGGGALGVSARGHGTVTAHEGHGVVSDDFRLEGVDFTMAPASGHFVNRTMICESAPLEPEEHVLSEDDLETRYRRAVSESAYTGTREDLFAIIQDTEGMALLGIERERFRQARLAGFTGSLNDFLDTFSTKEE